ncbi:MAG: hypothetical protein AAF253_14190 [Pseudomonadota bacterium]
MGPTRAILTLCMIFLCAAFVYVMGVVGDDPINGPDPRICPLTQAVASDADIIAAALESVMSNTRDAGIVYPSVAALKASEPHIRFNSEWHWLRWQEDRSVRMSHANSGAQFVYTVQVAYRHSRDGDKPFAVESYRIDECAQPLGGGVPVGATSWTETMYRQAVDRSSDEIRTID